MKEQVPKKAQRHRPKVKQRAIIEAADELFLKHGYDGTSIDMIAERAGVSRQTIYNQYESKEALFSAVTTDFVQEILLPLTASIERSDGLRETLIAFASRLMTALLLPRTRALYRLTITEAQRFPALGRAVYAAAVEATERNLASYLRAQSELQVPDPIISARQFFALVSHPINLKINLGIEIDPDDRELPEHLYAAVDTFLRAFGKAGGR